MRTSFVLAGVAVSLALACGPTRLPPTPPQTPPPPPPSRTGVATYAFVFDPSHPAATLAEDVRFLRPVPRGELAPPAYPDDALRAGDGPHRELVRIVIDDNGTVADVGDSPLGASDGGRHAASFRAAVDGAVRRWRFQPGLLRKVGPGNDLDGDGKPDYVVTTAQEPVPVYYDVGFTFAIVEGKGIVTRE
jgi:hypothetical protein